MKDCDLVMKGGIASGVVYGGAIAEIATEYRFCNIAGSSAGAIAACFAAAAEHRRQTGGGDAGFEAIQDVNAELTQGIARYFQPAPPFRPLFRAVLKGLRTKTVRAGFFAYLSWREGAAASLIATLALLILLISEGGGLLGDALTLLAFTGLGALVASIIAYLRAARDMKRLARSAFGLCPGTEQPGTGNPGLTDWIAAQIEAIAGRRTDAPLTIGDLEDHGISLAAMSTDLSTGRAYRLPIGAAHHFFSPSEFARLFPTPIVEHMIATSGTALPSDVGPGDLRPLPPRRALPIVVVARMSLSFPFLFEAVPLWRRDAGLPGKDTMRRCLFSDGGISSNFPIHFFDAFLPNRPTFGIFLSSWSAAHDGDDAGSPTEEDLPARRVSLYDPDPGASTPYGAPLHDALRITPIGSVADFITAIIDTAKDWRDTLQTRLPGGAERIVTIRLKDESEGGLNLEMDSTTTDRLVRYGAHAGRALITAFEDGQRFDRHRYLRALSLFSEMEHRLDQMEVAYHGSANPLLTSRPYPDILTGGVPGTPDPGSAWRCGALAAFAERLIAARADAAGTPRITAPFDPAEPPGTLRVAADARAEADMPGLDGVS